MNREVCGDRGKRVVLRWEKLLSRDTAHPYLAEMLDFPAYYGKNLDALYDCLTDLGECTLVVEGAGILRRAGGYGERVLRVLEEASRANPALGLVCPEEEKTGSDHGIHRLFPGEEDRRLRPVDRGKAPGITLRDGENIPGITPRD